VLGGPVLVRQGGAAAFAALAAYVAVAGRSLRRLVRAGLLAGLFVLTLGFAGSALLVSARPKPNYIGIFIYGELAPPRPPLSTVAGVAWHGALGAVVPLLGYGCLAVAVLASPARRRRLLLSVAGPVGLLALAGWIAWQLWRPEPMFLDRARFPEALALIAGPLLVALLAIGATTLATQRVQAGLLTAGMLLTALATVPALDLYRVTFAPPDVHFPPEPLAATAFRWLSAVNLVHDYHEREVLPAVLALAQVLGALFVAVGAVRAGSGHRAPGGPGGDLGT